MTTFLIILIVYLGIGYILHANLYRRPTVEFKRGVFGTTIKQQIIFALFWIIIVTNRAIYNWWVSLSYE